MFNQMIEKSIHKSQHCQRNWDLSREIPTEDLETIKTAATQCPSKQNESFYKVVFVHDRDTINKIADCTKGFSTRMFKLFLRSFFSSDSVFVVGSK